MEEREDCSDLCFFTDFVECVIAQKLAVLKHDYHFVLINTERKEYYRYALTCKMQVTVKNRGILQLCSRLGLPLASCNSPNDTRATTDLSLISSLYL